MELLSQDIRDRLLQNGRIRRDWPHDLAEPDFIPVVKLFTPFARCIWLLTELDPDEPDIAFGLCDLGMGFPELGSVSIAELESVRGRIRIERDRGFCPNKSLSAYAAEATRRGEIVA